jgi:hypothetical protein
MPVIVAKPETAGITGSSTAPELEQISPAVSQTEFKKNVLSSLKYDSSPALIAKEA